MKKIVLALSLSVLFSSYSLAETVTVDMNIVTADGVADKIGTVEL